jgi:putative transport protein
MAPTGRPDIGYAVIFPSTTIMKVIAMQVVGLVMVGSDLLTTSLTAR